MITKKNLPKSKIPMHLNLAEKNPSRLLCALQSAFAEEPETLLIELLGPGMLLHDTALMLHEEIRNRPRATRVHARARTCLIDGAILLWLAADTRSMRKDTWIQISTLLEESLFVGSDDYPYSIRASEECPADTDFRAVVEYLEEYLPVKEIAGLRLFEPDLRDLGLLHDPGETDWLALLLNSDDSHEPPSGYDSPDTSIANDKSTRPPHNQQRN